MPRWVFCYVGNKTNEFSSKKRIFCPKMTKFGPKLAFLSSAGSFGALLVGWLVVVAQAVSRKTPIYFIICFCSAEDLWPLWSGYSLEVPDQGFSNLKIDLHFFFAASCHIFASCDNLFFSATSCLLPGETGHRERRPYLLAFDPARPICGGHQGSGTTTRGRR